MSKIKLNGSAALKISDETISEDPSAHLVSLTPMELRQIREKPQTRLCRMVFHGAACRQKHQAKEMRRRSLSGKWGGFVPGGK